VLSAHLVQSIERCDVALIVMRRGGRFRGKLIWYYLLFYSVARFAIEFFRGDPRGFLIPGHLSVSQAIGIPAFLIAVYMLLRKNKMVS
jgi:prolipoprotein diacylglyceryltransferase